MGVGFKTFSAKTVGPSFIIRNSTSGRDSKAINIFGIKLNPGESYDLLNIPEVSEADIQHSLIKGDLKNRFLTNVIELVSSNINLIVFDPDYRSYLASRGFETGLDSIKTVVEYPNIRVAAGTPTAPTAVEAGPTFGWQFDVNDRVYFEHPFHTLRDPEKNMIIGIGWAPASSESGKTVSWQVDFSTFEDGSIVSAIENTITLQDLEMPSTAGTYVRSGVTVTAAMISNGNDEIHCRITRVASSNDPTTPPGLHHIAVIQTLAQAT